MGGFWFAIIDGMTITIGGREFYVPWSMGLEADTAGDHREIHHLRPECAR